MLDRCASLFYLLRNMSSNLTEPIDIDAERLTYWYLRLNGFLTITSFIVHPDKNEKNPRTEVDILGVRFPHRSERGFPDDKNGLRVPEGKIFFVLTEVKTGKGAKINPTLTNPEEDNIRRIVCALGPFADKTKENEAVDALYKKRGFEDSSYAIAILSVGNGKSKGGNSKYPEYRQITFKEILLFIYKRFSSFKGAKKSHSQWDAEGKKLWAVMEKYSNTDKDESEKFVKAFKPIPSVRATLKSAPVLVGGPA